MTSVKMTAFRRELEKIAGELQGATRIGIKPIGVDRLLEREREATDAGKTPATLFDVPLDKVAAKIDPKTLKALGLVGAGAGGYHVTRQAARDYQTGRQIRKQQGY